MSDPRTYWLIVTNIILGALVFLLLLGIATGVICELLHKLRHRSALMHEIDTDMQHFFK